MTDRINHVERLDRIMEQLADSVLELSDEAIVAETAESGADPQQEAERTRLVLRQAAELPEVVNGNQRIVGRSVR
jgi:hypothetical protein